MRSAKEQLEVLLAARISTDASGSKMDQRILEKHLIETLQRQAELEERLDNTNRAINHLLPEE